MTFINHSRLQLQIMSCSPTHGIVTISHINSLCYMCTIIYLYLYKEWCHNVQARIFEKGNKFFHQMGQPMVTLLQIQCVTRQRIHAAQRKRKLMEKEMSNLRTQCFLRLPDFFFQSKCKIKTPIHFHILSIYMFLMDGCLSKWNLCSASNFYL